VFVTILDSVVVCMLVRLLVRLLGVDDWNGVEVGVDVEARRGPGVDGACYRTVPTHAPLW